MKPNINFQLIKQLELTNETKQQLKTAGIYRIYITNPKNNQQQSYIGISNNIFNRLNTHRRIINQLKENKKIKISKRTEGHLLTYFLEYYENKRLNEKFAMYQKITLKLTEFNLTYADIHIEILEFIKDYKNMELIKIEAKEQEYIKQYNAEKQGLNGIFYYIFKEARAILTATPEQLKKIKKQEKDKQQKNKKMLINALKNNEQINEWLYWQIKAFNKWLDIDDGQKLLKKYKKTNEWNKYCNKIIKKIRQNAETEIKKLLKTQSKDYKKIIKYYKWLKTNEQQGKHKEQQLKELNKDYKKLKVKEQQLKHTKQQLKNIKQQLKHKEQQLKELNKDYKKLNELQIDIKEFYKKLDYISYKIYLLKHNEQDKYIEQLNNFIEQITNFFNNN